MDQPRVVQLHRTNGTSVRPPRPAVLRRTTHSERLAPIVPDQRPKPITQLPLRGNDNRAEPDGLRARAKAFGEFLYRRASGDYDVDEFGFDKDLTDNVLLPALRAVYENWFRVEVTGAENLPADGGALLVSNHSGTLPWDAAMVATAVHDNSPGNRHLRMLAADLVFDTPLLGTFARKTGQTLACNPDGERLLRQGNLVGVWPEGFKGIGKPFSERYKLQRFGRGGFVSVALRTGVPIIPVSVVGAEEIHPKIADLKPLARLLGLPYFPVTPLFPLFGALGAIPLPTKWRIEFGAPVRTDQVADIEDPMLMFNLTDQVRETIQQTLYRILDNRGNPFTG